MSAPAPTLLALALVAGCTATLKAGRGPRPPAVDAVQVTDEGPDSGYQDFWFGTYNRGRGNVVADFDGDGDPDLFSGNPGGYSFLIRNTTPPGGPLQFEPWQVLSETELFYGGAAADFDGDGDLDLFVATGANDGNEPDRMFRNDLDQGAPTELPLTDVSGQMELVPRDASGAPVPTGSMGANAFDADLDGWIDMFVSNFASAAEVEAATPDNAIALNQLYLNHGDFDLEDQAVALGMTSQAGSRHSAVLDFDRDGDLDVYENNFVGRNMLWRNLLVEQGTLEFTPSNHDNALGTTDLGGPVLNQAMCALSTDLDNDGWEDLLVLNRGTDGDPALAIPGHQIFMNQAGLGFVEVGEHSNLSDGFQEHPVATTEGPMGSGWGVMGCQVGDVNLDGFPDVFIGTGVGAAGDTDRLFVSSSRELVTLSEGVDVVVPQFDDWTELLDFPADPVDGAPEVPYPYRTHGSAFADYDGDGIPELGVHNGGPAAFDFLEPNRLWKFHLPDPRFVRILLRGDGVMVNRDAVGTRVRVAVERDRDGARWEVQQTRVAGSGFGAQNEPELTIGLGDADRILSIVVSWPDGHTEPIDPPAELQSWITVAR